MYQEKKTIKKLTLTRVRVKRGVDNSRIRLERERGRVIERCFDISNVTTVRQRKREVLMRVHCGALFIWHGQTGPHGDRSNHLVRLVASSTREWYMCNGHDNDISLWHACPMCAIREECRMRKLSDSYSERLNLELLEKRGTDFCSRCKWADNITSQFTLKCDFAARNWCELIFFFVTRCKHRIFSREMDCVVVVLSLRSSNGSLSHAHYLIKT